MIMEHFEIHKEHLEDLIVDLDKYGPKLFADIKRPPLKRGGINSDELALIDEMSGFTSLIDNIVNTVDAPV